jgi:hypothetical protein
VRKIIDLENPQAWRRDLIDFLDAHHDQLLAWEYQRDDGTKSDEAVLRSAMTYDRTISQLCAILDNYFLTGWHCTRLTDAEITNINTHGMQPPSLELLRRRIDAIEAEGAISFHIANRLRSENHAGDDNRAQMIWFCFYPPHIGGGEHGIGRFFKSWGGEALYSSHEGDPETGPVLGKIGTPCLVQADVPNASFKERSLRLASKIVIRFLISRGCTSTKPAKHDDRVICAIPPENIRRIITYPERDFIALTRCDTWRTPLRGWLKNKRIGPCHKGSPVSLSPLARKVKELVEESFDDRTLFLGVAVLQFKTQLKLVLMNKPDNAVGHPETHAG